MDVRNQISITNVVKKVECTIGEIDILVNVAGIFENISVFQTSEKL